MALKEITTEHRMVAVQTDHDRQMIMKRAGGKKLPTLNEMKSFYNVKQFGTQHENASIDYKSHLSSS